MTEFEMAFNLTGLVLSLSLVVVLIGLGRALRPRQGTHIGWLTPILGIWMLGDIATFWGMAWEVRDLMPGVWASIGGGLVLTSTYYIAASLVFPEDFDKESDLDDYYWRYNRIVIGLVLAVNLAAFAISLTLGRIWSPAATAINVLYIGGMLVAFFVRGPRANIAALLFLIGILVWSFATP
jgi:hypothetical protein